MKIKHVKDLINKKIQEIEAKKFDKHIKNQSSIVSQNTLKECSAFGDFSEIKDRVYKPQWIVSITAPL